MPDTKQQRAEEDRGCDVASRGVRPAEEDGRQQAAERRLLEKRHREPERFARFGLSLHPDKTRLIEFGRFAVSNRRARGAGKPETFNFPGFTHACSHTRKGQFTVWRQTVRQRLQAKLRAVKTELRRRLYAPIPEQGADLRSVVVGHTQYYGVPRNGPSLTALHAALVRLWRVTLQRRSQTGFRAVDADARPEGALASWASHLSSVPQPALGGL